MTKRWPLGLSLTAGALVLSLGMGLRQSFGLFLQPMDRDLGLGLGVFSLAMALQQLLWGVFQPISGMASDKYGPGPVLGAGLGIYAAGLALFNLLKDPVGAYLGLGFLTGIGVSACGFAVVLSAVAKIVPPERRSMAMGIVSAGGSFGQFALAPVSALLIENAGWQTSLWIFVCLMVASIPLGYLLSAAPAMQDPESDDQRTTTSAAPLRLDAALKLALADPSYRLLAFGFFVCGFHVAFVATHLPGVIAACNLPVSMGATALALLGIGNMIGSYSVGYLGQHFQLKKILSGLYLIRALTIAVFMISPKTSMTFILFSSALGITWLSTVAPTNGLVAKLHGTQYVSTLFGIVYFVHQLGGFLGAWAGGVSVELFASYDPVWIVAALLALMSSAAHWPIREAPLIGSQSPQPSAG